LRIRISHDIEPGFPAYPDNPPPLAIEPVCDYQKGNACQTAMLHLYNHAGTHFDGPRHFNPQAPLLHQLPLTGFFFDSPVMIDIPKGDMELIAAGELEPHAAAIAGADLLLIRAGWTAVRAQDPRRYAERGPGLSEAAAKYLMDGFAGLRAVGIDFISLACPVKGKIGDGIRAHQALLGLGRADGRYVLAIEDMNLPADLEAPKRVIALPLFVAGVDSAPCTVIAEY
jgi:arylformamidase